jgi:FkbM family methyltransferase
MTPYRSGFLARLGGRLQDAGTKLLRRQGGGGTWIDVGAHLGEFTMGYARSNPALTVFAFEPNWSVARKMMGQSANFMVFPMAVAEQDGLADFHVNAADDTSSLLPFDPEGLEKWKGSESLRTEATVRVPTIRLDTFMNLMGLSAVDYLKIDAQGADLAVVRSAGSRLHDIQKIKLEVDVNPVRVYRGSAGREETVGYLEGQGFSLSSAETQTDGQEENLTFVRRAGLGR